MVTSWQEYEQRCETAYNLYYGPERVSQANIGKRLGVSQQQIYKYIKHWRLVLAKREKPILDLTKIPQGPVETPIPQTISELTETLRASKILSLADKPFHQEWYDYANVQRRFLLLAPRRHAKSTCLSVNYVLWRIIKNPNIRILLVSNTDLQARGFVRVIKQLIEQYYPSFIPNGREKWAETAIAIKRDQILRDPTLSAVGVNGPIISRRLDLIVCDDCVDPENAASEQLREKVYDWFYKTLIPALEPNGQIIIIGTPFGPDDLYARLQMDKWPFRRYDAIVDEEKKLSMWPEVLPFECAKGLEEGQSHKGHCCLVALRRQMGTIRFNAQYRCDPSGYSGNKLKIEWIKNTFYRTLPDKLDEIVIGVDPAITERTGGDYFAMATVGYSEKENLIYAMDFYRAHLTFPEQLAAIAETWKMKRAQRIIIESVAYQKALAQGVQGMGLPVVPYKTISDKVTRVMNISPYFENHMVRIKEDADEFIHEYVQFDKGDHDDLLDALCLAVQDIIDRHTARIPEHHPLVDFAVVFKSRIPEMSSSPLFVQSKPVRDKDVGEPGEGKVRTLNMSTGQWEWRNP